MKCLLPRKKNNELLIFLFRATVAGYANPIENLFQYLSFLALLIIYLFMVYYCLLLVRGSCF